MSVKFFDRLQRSKGDLISFSMNPNCFFRSIYHLLSILFLFTGVLSCAKNNSTQKYENLAGPQVVHNIIGGQDLGMNKKLNLSVAAILRTSFDGRIDICTGTFITKNIILTAAHCVSEDPSDLQIKIGNSVISNHKSISLTAFKIIRHQDYELGKNDLALIQINHPEFVKKNISIRPVELVTDVEFEQKNNFILFGYGINQIDSFAADDDLQGSGELRKANISEKLISKMGNQLIIDQSNTVGACHGDSGGPAFILDQKNTYKIIGVASGVQQSELETDCAGQSVYTNLNSFKPWILQSISDFDRD